MLWRIKWWFTGVLSDYIADVFIRDGPETPNLAELVGLTVVVWVFTAALSGGVAITLTAGNVSTAAVLGVLLVVWGAVSVIHTASAAWYSYEYYQQTPEQRIGVSER